MRDPFKIDGPTCISFSGGRSSAYMLRLVLDSNGGLPADAHVVFANTGKEDEATLRFVVDCSERWSVPIEWVEYQPAQQEGGPLFKRVTFETASRKGEPFDAMIAGKQYLPNPMERFCTVILKVIPAIQYMRWRGHNEHDNLLGMRADEPERVAKIHAKPSGGSAGVDRRAPLAEAGKGKHDVAAFWRAQPFDLALPLVNGKTIGGNCDLCFNKPPFERLSLIRAKPQRVIWWDNHERKRGARFTKDGPSYAQLAAYARDQRDMFDPDEEAIPCFCGD